MRSTLVWYVFLKRTLRKLRAILKHKVEEICCSLRLPSKTAQVVCSQTAHLSFVQRMGKNRSGGQCLLHRKKFIEVAIVVRLDSRSLRVFTRKVWSYAVKALQHTLCDVILNKDDTRYCTSSNWIVHLCWTQCESNPMVIKHNK